MASSDRCEDVVADDEDTGGRRYRLDVMAGSVVEAVSFAGGWIFDHAAGGWEVTVLIPDCPRDFRPLHILGARAVDLETELHVRRRIPATLGVSAGLYAVDSRALRAVHNALRRTAEVTVWGARLPPELRGCTRPAHHRLSTAARAFKLRALDTAGTQCSRVDAAEIFGLVQRTADRAGRLRRAPLGGAVGVARPRPTV